MSDSPEKIWVETTGDFMFIDVHAGQEIEADGSSEVFPSQFVQDKIREGHLVKVDAPKNKKAPAPAA